jgi:hypothetical protein
MIAFAAGANALPETTVLERLLSTAKAQTLPI